MTSIKLMLTGAQAWAVATGPLTSGMVGIPVTIEYDEAWDGLRKNLMCRCSPWGSTDGEYRAILNVGDTATVAHEVMLPDMYLYLGIEGYSDDGTLVMPTTWARCGKIEYGASTCEDPSTDPELTVWNQLQIEMEKTREYVLTPEQATNIQAYAQTASQAAQEAQQAAEEVMQAVESGLYYIPVVSQPTDTTLKFEFKPSLTGVPIPKPVTVELPTGGDTALTTEQINALDGMFKVCAYDSTNDYAGAYAAFKTAFGITDSDDDTTQKTLTGISATYSGGSVAVGTSVSALTGVVVTATYDDGSTAAVTDYTLSGEIAEGENTVTVTYQDMTATFTVTGMVSGGEDAGPFDGTWVEGVYLAGGNENTGDAWASHVTSAYVSTNGYTNVIVENDTGKLFQIRASFYDSDKIYFADGGSYVGTTAYPSPLTIAIPDGTAYVRLSTSIKQGSESAGYAYYTDLKFYME